MAENISPDFERRGGTLEEALANGRKLLADHPRLAVTQAQAILKQDPAHGDALRLAASAHRALGEPRHALNAEMAAIAASERLPVLKAAAKALEDKEYGEASRLAAEHLRRSPDDLAALTLSAEAAIALGLSDKGEPLLREVLGRAPAFFPARQLLLNALMLLDRLTEARAMLKQMIAEGTDDRRSQYRMLARIESDLGDHAAAATTCELLLQLEDTQPDDWIDYGNSLRFSNRKSDAVGAYRRALAIDPAIGRAWWGIADIDSSAITDEDLAQMEAALAGSEPDPESAVNLRFALGIVLDSRRKPEKAFPHIMTGNELRKAAQVYDAGELTRQVDRYLGAMPNLPGHETGAAAGIVPVFVVGMPRSGSTLVERILGRHSQIEALGELPIVPHVVQRLEREQAEDELEARIASLSADELATRAQWYLDRASERRRTDKPYFIDKLHMNWKHLPLILRMLPQARIVDVRRDALDCCWSNYKTLFARGHPAASDMDDLGRFYRDYVRLTDALRARAPDRIHLLDYERLVDDIEGEAGALFAALGLPFEPQCLEFHLSAEPVATASSEQVRRPLNRNGIGAWRPYEPWLGPLKDALGDLAQTRD